jgi:hypothetical protein
MGMSNWDLPERDVVFWPVGNGDAVTIAVDDDRRLEWMGTRPSGKSSR